MKEMQWFIKAAAPFKGMEINVVSETLTTHEYESRTLAKAFEEITGIKVKHDIIQEGDVVEKIQTQMQSARTSMTAGSNDSDSSERISATPAVDLNGWRARARTSTDPQLDVNDFIGSRSRPRRTAISTSCPTSSREPYWFRYDWFSIPTTRRSSRPVRPTTSVFP